MTVEIAVVYGLLVVALVLFAMDRFPVDAVAMGVLVALALSGIVTPAEALAGFSNEATVTVAAMFVLSAGLRRTGALDGVGELLSRVGRRSQLLAVAALMVVVGLLSGFINNTAAVAIFIPIVIDLARTLRVSPSQLLIPLSFASMFGGVTTLIGTSTNLLVDSLARERGLEGFGMFDFLPVGAALFVVGLLYLLATHRRIPARRPPEREDLTDRFDVGPSMIRIELAADAPGIGSPLDDNALERDFGLEVVDVDRHGSVSSGTDRVIQLEAGDVVRVQGPPDALSRIAGTSGIRLVESAGQRHLDAALETDDDALVEAVLAPESPLTGSTIDDLDLAERHGAQALGVRQSGTVKHELPTIRLHSGDSLLLKIDRSRLGNLRDDRDFVVVSERDGESTRRSRMPAAIALVVAVVVAAASGVVPIVAAAVAGALAMVGIGALAAEEVYDEINWTVIFLLAGVLPLGTAMESSGAAALLADAIVEHLDSLGPTIVLAGVILATQLLTEVISNNASAVLFAPIAIGAGQSLGVDPRPFLVGVTVAASMSFMTPIGYQTNTMIYGPGQYRFTDFTAIGAPLNLVVLVIATLVIPVAFPF